MKGLRKEVEEPYSLEFGVQSSELKAKNLESRVMSFEFQVQS